MNKIARLRRAARTRARIKKQKVTRLTVHRTPRHIFAQILEQREDGQTHVLVSASTVEKIHKGKLKGTKTELAKKIGETVAKRAVEAGIKQVAFDRSGFKYHGRVKALAEAARENGLQF